MADAPAPETGTTETDTAAATSDQPSPPEKGEPTRLPDDHPLVKAAAARKAELNETKLKLKEFEDAQLSETERLTNDLAAEAARAANAETELARLRVAVKHGIADADLDLLGDGNPDQLEARAKRIAELRGQQADQATRSPVSSLGNHTEPVADADAWLRGLALG